MAVRIGISKNISRFFINEIDVYKRQHGTLPFPEGTACAEVLLAGEEGVSKAGTVFSGLGVAAAYKFIADGLKVFPSEIGYDIKAYAGSSVGVQVLQMCIRDSAIAMAR